MNVLQLVFKQMRQRALSTWLTLLSVMLGVALAVAVSLLSRESDKLFGQSDYGYDVIIGPKGSQLGLVLNTVYQLGQSTSTIPYALYERMPQEFRGSMRWAVPIAVGDQWDGHRIVATTPAMFGLDDDGQPLPEGRSFEYRVDRAYSLGEGRVFHPRKFEAVVGAEIAEKGLGLGAKFQPEHGTQTGGSFDDTHAEQWEVVGVLDRTGTASDRVIFIPLVSFYAIPEHEQALEAFAVLNQGRTAPAPEPAPIEAPPPVQDEHAHDHDAEAHADEDEHEVHEEHDEHAHEDEDAHDEHAHEADEAHARAPATAEAHDAHADEHDEHGDHDDHAHDQAYVLTPDGEIDLRLPQEKWKLSAIMVRSRGGQPAMSMIWRINNQPDAMAVNPALEMRQFFDTFLKGGSRLLLMVSLLVTIVAAVSILVSIYNSVAARKREVAILRALGATRIKILTLICLEAGLIGLFGGVLGVVVGHLIGAGGSIYLEALMGERINWLAVGAGEGIYLAVVVGIALLAGLVPALKAYGTPVATNLVSA